MAYLTRKQVLDIINKAPANINKENLLKELAKTNTIEGYNEPVKQTSFIKDVARDIIKPFAQSAELLSSGAKAYGGIMKAGYQLATGKKEEAKKTFLETGKKAQARPQVTVLGQDVGRIETGKQAAGTALNLASNLVGGAGAKTVVGQGFKQGLKALAKEGATAGAKAGALYGAGEALSKDKNVVKGALSGAAVGGATGGVFGAATGAATSGLIKTGEKIFDIADTKLYNTAKDLLKMSPTASKKEAKWGKDTARFIVSEPITNENTGKTTSILGMIKADGKYLNNKEAIEAVASQASKENEAFETILKDSGIKISIDDWGRLAKKNIREDLANRGTDLEKAVIKIDEEISAYKNNALNQGVGEQIGNDVLMDADKFNMLKRGAWEKSSVSRRVPGSELEADLFYQMGHAAKDLIENKIDDADIARLNKRLGDFAQAQKVLESADGKVVPGGFFGKQAAKIAGTVAGASSGIIGSIIGNLTGGALADIIQNPKTRTGAWVKVYEMLNKTPKGRTIIEEAKQILKKRGEERASRLLLEAHKYIPLQYRYKDTSRLLTQEEAQNLLDVLKIKEPLKLLNAPGKNAILLPSKTQTAKELIQNKQVLPKTLVKEPLKSELQTSIQKAKAGGKTFDEWIKEQSLYHGTPNEIEGDSLKFGAGKQLKKGGYMGGHFLTDTPEIAENFSFGGKVYYASGKIKDKVLDVNKNKKLFEDFIGKEYLLDGEKVKFTKQDFDYMFPRGEADWSTINTDLLEQITKKEGKIGIVIPEYAGGIRGMTYQIFEDNIPVKTRSQLKKEWDKIK